LNVPQQPVRWVFFMNKDAFYFPHFSNARTDRKLLRVRKELGIEGYGIYFMILEVLRDTPEYKYPLEDIDLLALEFVTSEQKVRTVICNYTLFEVDENQCFFSAKFNEYLEPYLRMKQQRIDAGKASAAKRMLNDRSTTVQQSKVKESKVKESKLQNSVCEKQDFSILTTIEALQAQEFVYRLGRKDITIDDVFNYWQAFIIHKPDYNIEHRGRQMQHFRNWLKLTKKENGTTTRQSRNKESIDILLNSLADDLHRAGGKTD